MITDILTIKTPGEVAVAAADPPTAIEKIPTYFTLFNQPELYQHIHVHAVCVRPKNTKNSEAGLFPLGIFGLKSIFKKMNAFVEVETYGNDTGSNEEWFQIGKHRFLPCRANNLPVWDSKFFVIGKKGSQNTEGIKLAVKNGDEELFEFNIPSSEFPEIGEDWKEFTFAPKDTAAVKGVEFVCKVRISDGTDQISGKDALATFLQDSETISYSEEVVEGQLEVDNALVQCWRQKNTVPRGAVLWVIGRNDCFMHPHVAEKLFTGKGYDLYVLNYSANGMCRKRGWVKDSLLQCHNRTGSCDLYLNQVGGAINLMKSYKDYNSKIGYSHSTGSTILIHYLMKKGDNDFDGFIFNAPFLDWSADAVGGNLFEFAIENLKLADALSSMNNDTQLKKYPTPDENKDNPLLYLGSEIILSYASSKLFSLYSFDWRARPLYRVPVTVGFAKSVTEVHKELKEWKRQKKYVTLKPIMCIASRSDPVLTTSETLNRIDAVGPSRCEIELHDNYHDVFLSIDEKDVTMAIDMVSAWMKSQNFE